MCACVVIPSFYLEINRKRNSASLSEQLSLKQPDELIYPPKLLELLSSNSTHETNKNYSGIFKKPTQYSNI